jgi:hypothetical protein
MFPLLLQAQLEINLPKDLNIIVDESDLPLSAGWLDSLSDEALSGKIRYKIVGASSIEGKVTTKIHIPQILSLGEVFRQVVLYYSMINNEHERENETLYVYPYFIFIENTPSLMCRYESEANFYFEINNWDRVPIPPQPTLEEKDVFNQVLQASFNNIQKFSSIDEKIFRKIALQNDLSVARVRQIYQNTILWQLAEYSGQAVSPLDPDIK